MTASSASSPPVARALGEEIEIYRRARELTPAEASRQIGCSTSQISRWRRGGGISMYWLEKVALWMGRPLADLLPLAGYPALDASSAPSADEPNDRGFRAVKAAWAHLPDHRRQVMIELAVGVHEPRLQHHRTPDELPFDARLVDIRLTDVDQTEGDVDEPKRESRSVRAQRERYGFQPWLKAIRRSWSLAILSTSTSGSFLRAEPAA